MYPCPHLYQYILYKEEVKNSGEREQDNQNYRLTNLSSYFKGFVGNWLQNVTSLKNFIKCANYYRTRGRAGVEGQTSV